MLPERKHDSISIARDRKKVQVCLMHMRIAAAALSKHPRPFIMREQLRKANERSSCTCHWPFIMARVRNDENEKSSSSPIKTSQILFHDESEKRPFIMMRSCIIMRKVASGPILTVSKPYQNPIKTQSKPYQNPIKTLSKPHQNPIKTLLKRF